MRESRCDSAASIISRVRDACGQEALLEAFDTIAIISVTDNNGKIIYANNQFLVISGYSETEVIGQSPRILSSDCHPPAFLEELWQTIAGGKIWRGELGARAKDGSTFWVDTVITPCKDDRGEIQGYASAGIDITQGKLAEEKLLAQTIQLETALNNMARGLSMFDSEARLIVCNKSYREIYNLPEALSQPGTPFSEIIRYHAKREAGREGTQDLEGQREWIESHVARLARGKSFSHTQHLNNGRTILVIYQPLRNGGWVDLQEDITERERNASERLRVEQIKNEFISTVSHELRTPLTSIAGSLALLTGGTAGELSEKAARLIAIAHDNSQRLVRLVNDILDIEKIESGHFKLNFEPLDLRDIAQRSMDSVKGYADKLGVRLLLADGPPAPVRGDPDRLIQVITNLLSNACKFSPAGAGITVSVNREGHLARLSVRDRGPGIPEEFRARVFSKFAQAEGPDTRAKGGTGLGLVIAREISDLHGGRLWFESKPGEGATFHLDLPLSPQVVEGHEPPRLLVCEDDNQKAAILRQILKRDGFSIDIASTLDDSLRMAATGDYAASLIDLHLPGADSIGLIRALRARPETRDLPIVFITAVVGVEGRLLVVVDWLDKPLDHVRLRAALAASLDSSFNRPLVLHVGDDRNNLRVTASALSDTADVIPVQSLSAARAALAAHRPDLVILDLELADGSGPDLLAELSDKMGRTIPVIVYSAQEMEPDVVQRVDAVLTKSRTSLAGLAPTIQRLIDKNKAQRPAQP